MTLYPRKSGRVPTLPEKDSRFPADCLKRNAVPKKARRFFVRDAVFSGRDFSNIHLMNMVALYYLAIFCLCTYSLITFVPLYVHCTLNTTLLNLTGYFYRLCSPE